MRLIAERLLHEAAGKTYVQGELISKPLRPLPLPAHPSSHHIYCSGHNPDALELMHELAAAHNLQLGPSLTGSSSGAAKSNGELRITTDAGQLHKCQHMLLYLTSETWTRGRAGASSRMV